MSIIHEARPTWAEINLAKLEFNFNSVKKFIVQDLKYMAVVKANAYGHGAVECARTLEKAKIDCFGVSLPEEGLELRKNSIKSPIICLGGFWAGQENLLLDNDLIPVVYRLDMAEKLNRAAEEKNVNAKIHVKIDTGMGRIGVRFNEVNEFAKNLKKLKNIRLEGLMTHFAVADDLSQNKFTEMQIKRFYDAVEIFEGKGFHLVYKDLANSPGAIAHKNSRGNLVRLGGILYGLGRDILPKEVEKPKLRAVLSLHSRIALIKNVPKGETLGYGRSFRTVKNSLIATVPIGYYDGYRRSFSNRGKVIINKNFAPVVGRVSMDWTIVDVSEIPNVKVNDEVIFIGSQGNLEIKAEDLAEMTGTISYEVTCGIGSRVRKYFK
ncbi:MAG: alanine racemase [Acidobacteriota bacterium]|nr:alanine racemase [Acidobacteriota bacterium]